MKALKTIFDRENWRETLQTLARNKTRTLLTAFGIFWGTAMLAMLWGGADGVTGMMRRNFDGFSTNMGAAIPWRTSMPYKGYAKGMSWHFRDDDIEAIRRSTDKIDCSTPVLMTGVTGRYGTKSSHGTLIGVEADYFKIQLPLMQAGRTFNESDVASSRKVVVIGQRRAEELFGADPEDALGKYVEINSVYMQVIGVATQKSQVSLGGNTGESYIIPATTMRRLYNSGDNFGMFMFTAKQGSSPNDILPVLRRVVSRHHPVHPDDTEAMTFIDASEMFATVDTVFVGISLLALFVGVGTLLAGIIGVGNIMWIIVKERTHEIGIRRALGARPADIIVQILSESVLLTTVAGVAGIVFGALVLGVTDHATADPILGSPGYQLPFGRAVAILLSFLVLGTAAGIVPALKSMRIKPVEAINEK